MRSGQERPADFDLTSFFVIAMESRRADDLSSFVINGDQRSAGLEALVKERAEDFRFVTI